MQQSKIESNGSLLSIVKFLTLVTLYISKWDTLGAGKPLDMSKINHVIDYLMELKMKIK